MAKPTIPDALEMTRLKYGSDVTPGDRDRVAQALRRAGRRLEAILLYEGRSDHPDLQEDLRWSVSEGASFTLFALRRLGVPITDEHRRACAEAAERKGRWYDAHRLYEVLKDEVSLERVRAQIPTFKVAVPANKA
jgi:hypothetical protein